MEEALRRELGTRVSWPKPKGGFFLWVTLPRGIDADADDRARDRATASSTSTGDAFYVNGAGQNTLRLSFSAPTPERIDDRRRAARALRSAPNGQHGRQRAQLQARESS